MTSNNSEPTLIVNHEDKRNKKYSRIYPDTDGDRIIISGMSGKFPNSRNIDEYKHNLYNKIDMVDEEERRWMHFNPEIPKRFGKIYDIEKFDATFFGVHFKQTNSMDVQCRILMEVAYEAIIDAGINPKELRNSRTGVYIGCSISESEKTWFYSHTTSGGYGITGCSRAMLANRISYALGLNGPSFLVDTACSSSMYALDSAFSAFRNGEIDAAIVGGANLLLHPDLSLQFARFGVLAQNGYCRPFDKAASGYTRSEAISCIFLQRKRDAVRNYAEVVYSKTNCDGYKPEGITFPSCVVQEKLLHDFYTDVDITPNDLGYFEAHCTGTVAGDPVECRAIDNVICRQRKDTLLVGSVKSNVGHCEAASGISSLVKAVFAFETGKISPNLHFTDVREEIPALVEGRLTVVKDVTELRKPYIAINSFGFGGANAHALLKASDKKKIQNGLPVDDIPRVVGWAGRTDDAVNTVLDFIENTPLDAEYVALLHNIQKEDVTGLVSRGYGVYEKNGIKNAKCLARDVQRFEGINRPLVWVFSGMGSQWTEMGSSLMGLPIFRSSIERCHNALKPKGLDLIEILTSTDKQTFDNILHSFVGIAAIQIGLVDLMRALNLEPDYIIGHSVGELGCGYADGGFTPEQMILAAYYRGRVSQDIEKIRGSMAAIGLGYKQIAHLLPASIEVACHNGTDSSTISGPAEDVTRFVAELKAKGIFAKEVPSSNIAYHSRYIAHMGPQLLKYLKEAIPDPKQRSSKWLSSSVPKADWGQTGQNFCSAEYHTNNLLNSVLFEETFDLLPKNSLTIEIAPHGLLQAILKRSMPGGIHVSLTQRGHKNNMLFFLGALGKLFANGVTLFFENLYPPVQFPVSRGTPGISSLIKWDHREDWFVTKFDNMTAKCSGVRVFKINLMGEDGYINGHVIDGKIVLPATRYLQIVWETFSLMFHGQNYMDIPVEFEDVRFLRATSLSLSAEVELTVMIHYGTGSFEITESNGLVMTGIIQEMTNAQKPMHIPFEKESQFPLMSKKDFYKELKLRGYHYSGEFQAVRAARSDGLYGKIEWNYNWVTFLDAMLQILIIGTDSRTLLLPTKIRKLRINGSLHLKMMSEDQAYDLYSSQEFDRVVAGGIELIGLHASPIQRKKPPGVPILERYQFVPHLPAPKMTPSDAARICVQLALENVPVLKMKVVEVDTGNVVPIINHFLDAVEELPLVSGDFRFISNQTLKLTGVQVENETLSNQRNCYFVIAKNLLSQATDNIIHNVGTNLLDGGFLVARQSEELAYNDGLAIPMEFKLTAVIPTTDNEVIVVFQKQNGKFFVDPIEAIKISEDDVKFQWIKAAQVAVSKGPVVLYAENERFNGLIGLLNCLRKEPNGHLVRGVFVDDITAPPFDWNNPFYKKQLALGLGLNVYRNGQWGTYRHLKLNLDVSVLPRADHIYVNVINRGDLSSLRWFEGPLNPKDCEIKIVYSSINFRDIMLATGRLGVDIVGSNRADQSLILGLEYSGINTRTGKRIMGMVPKGGIASCGDKASSLIWEVPENWSLQEAATVPVVYITVYYAFFVSVDIRKGKSILIHAGTGGIGLAAIRVALSYGLEVFTTVSTSQKRQFLLNKFPQLKDSHIGNSRDTSFEVMIQRETRGKGVDLVLNSLSEDKLLASIRCLGRDGHFLEIGKFDMANDNKVGLGCFMKQLTFHAILADSLHDASDAQIKALKSMIDDDIASGIIQPLPSTVFPAYEVEYAFRHLVGGKHIGKVLIQIRNDSHSLCTTPVPVLKQVYFSPQLSYIIPGGLGGFGLELADWMVIRGARKLVLSSSRGISNDYQSYRIALWETYGCKVVVSTANITNRQGCELLLRDAIQLGPVGGIFNLAVALRDAAFSNQSVEKFVESFAPKAFACKYLDELSRKFCPDLRHFVVFSSVSCGRGNAGQTNYGMANSVMERVVEDRVANGFPGKAIQWGAVGEVGLVAEMFEDKIDMDIGGTLPQRISSCLHELDNLITSPDTIVSSMVVAEKRICTDGKQSIIQIVMNIMGVRDFNSVSLSTTFSEIGMDSLTAVELKQILERDFELVLTPQDLQSLTFQKLQAYVDAKDKKEAEAVEFILASKEKSLDPLLFLRNFGNEANFDQILLPVSNPSDASKLDLNPTIIFPGLDGTAGQVWYTIGKLLTSKAVVVQYQQTANLTSIQEVSQALFDNVKSVLKTFEKFYLIGYSFGSVIALFVAGLLEKAGYRGQVLLIDGAPHFVKKMTLAQLGENYEDEDIYNLIFSGVMNNVLTTEVREMTAQSFLPIDTVQDKVVKLLEVIAQQNLFSQNYAEIMMQAMFNRLKMMAELDLDCLDILTMPVILVRPLVIAMQDIDNDYCLSKLTKDKVILRFIEGNHITMLDNPKLAEIINAFDPVQQEEEKFKEYINDNK